MTETWVEEIRPIVTEDREDRRRTARAIADLCNGRERNGEQVKPSAMEKITKETTKELEKDGYNDEKEEKEWEWEFVEKYHEINQ